MTANVAVFTPNDTDVTTMDTATLKKEFISCLELTEKTLRRAANIAHELVKRGEKVPQVGDFNDWLKKIAGGFLHEKAIIRFCGNRSLLKKLETVPIEDQVEIAKGKKLIPVAVIKDNKPAVVRKKAENLDPSEVARAFDEKGLRPVEEQKTLLAKPIEKKKKAQKKTLHIDPKSKYLKLSNGFVLRSDGNKISANELVAALGQLYGIDLEKLIIKHAKKL